MIGQQISHYKMEREIIMSRRRAGTTVGSFLQLLTAALFLVGCGGPQGDSRPELPLGAYFEMLGRIDLEENDEVLTVFPMVSLTPGGQWLVTDLRESQVRLYSERGKLLQFFGGRGEGPGELNLPLRSVQLANGSIIVPEVTGRVHHFSVDGSHQQSWDRVLPWIVDTHPYSDSTFLLLGPALRAKGAYPLIHEVDSAGKIVTSFFPHPIPMGTYGNVLNAVSELVTVTDMGQKLLVGFGPLPNLYVLDRHGDVERVVEYELPGFRPISALEGRQLTNANIMSATLEFSRIHDVIYLGDGRALIQYVDLLDLQTWEKRYSLAHVDLAGNVLFELRDSPKIMAATGEAGSVWFSDPAQLVDNSWIKARVRQQVE